MLRPILKPAVLAVPLLLAGCRAPAGEPSGRVAADSASVAPADTTLPLGLALKDDGRAVELAAAQVLLVSLHANRSTGYGWALADSVGPALVREGEPAYHADSSAGVGAGGFEIWRFRGAAAGRDTIVLEYRRPWEAGRPPETTVRYFVSVR